MPKPELEPTKNSSRIFFFIWLTEKIGEIRMLFLLQKYKQYSVSREKRVKNVTKSSLLLDLFVFLSIKIITTKKIIHSK